MFLKSVSCWGMFSIQARAWIPKRNWDIFMPFIKSCDFYRTHKSTVSRCVRFPGVPDFDHTMFVPDDGDLPSEDEDDDDDDDDDDQSR